MESPTETTLSEVPPVPAAPMLPQLGTPNSERRTGKIARLPKTTRDQINQMIQDGVPYLRIIESLGTVGAGITEKNLSNWKAGGYIDWLREMQFTHAIQTKSELAQSIVERSTNGNGNGHAVLTIIAANLLEFLTETDPTTMRESLLSDSDKFTRFVNAMVRLAEGGVKCQLLKYKQEDRAAEAAKNSNPAQPGVSEEKLRVAETKLNLM